MLDRLDPASGPGPATHSYLAEGSTAWGFTTYFTIQNPNAVPIRTEIYYQSGQLQTRGFDVYLPALSQATVNPELEVEDQDFSIHVTCPAGQPFAVDRTMTWKGAGRAAPEAHTSIGVPAPATKWYFPEGSSRWGFESWLLLQNPSAAPIDAEITYMIEGEGPRIFNRTLPAYSRQTFGMLNDIGEKDASVMVNAAAPVVAERSMYRYNKHEGHESIGATEAATLYYLPEGTSAWGFTTYILIQNPANNPAEVTLTYMTPAGPHVQPAFMMPANSRRTVRANDALPGQDFSTLVSADGPIVAERAMYWDSGAGETCHDSIGLPQPRHYFYLPDGEDWNGAETWTLVQNQNPVPVGVSVTYLSSTGAGNQMVIDTIPAHSRRTYNMADAHIGGRAAIEVRCTTGQQILAERAMYWNGRTAGSVTIGAGSD